MHVGELALADGPVPSGVVADALLLNAKVAAKPCALQADDVVLTKLADNVLQPTRLHQAPAVEGTDTPR